MPGTGSANTTLIAYLVVFVPLILLGFYFARRKMFNPQHKLVMTSVVILNWVFIAVVMAASYGSNVAPQLSDSIGDVRVLLPTIHLVTGAIAQLMATYLVLLMWTENTALEGAIPVRIENIKTPMRATLALWLITVLLGFGIYGTWYTGDTPPADVTDEAPLPSTTEEAPEPGATEEADG